MSFIIVEEKMAAPKGIPIGGKEDLCVT